MRDSLSPSCVEHGGPAPRLLTDEERRGVRDRLDELAAANFYDHQRYDVRDELVRIARGLDLALVAREREVAELTAAMPTRQCMVCEDDVPVNQLKAGVCSECANDHPGYSGAEADEGVLRRGADPRPLDGPHPCGQRG